MRWQDLGLALLAVVTAALTILTFRMVMAPSDGGPGPDGSSAVSSPTSATASSPEAPDPVTPEQGGSTFTAAADGAGVSQGADMTRETGTATSDLAAARRVLDSEDPVVVAALGDSTGNETWEWVYGWGRLLAQTRPVTVVSWNEWTEDGYSEPRVLQPSGSGAQGPVTLYSGHHSGASVGYVVDHVDRLLPEQPDLVILNFGHNNAADEVTGELGEALAALRSVAGPDVPVVLTLQQPQRDDANAEVREAIRAFALAQELGVIDVARAFEDSGDPEALLADDVHPNEEGVAVWTQEVARTLSAP